MVRIVPVMVSPMELIHLEFQNTFGNAFACAAMMVISPGFGLALSSGVYCLIASCKTSFSCVAVALGKLRIWEALIVCSSKRKNCEDMVVETVVFGRERADPKEC